MHRRAFLRNGLILGGTAAGSNLLGWTVPAAGALAAEERGPGPYGPLDGRFPDDNGLVLPEGFSSRIVAVGGSAVGDTGYAWPLFPDGKGTFPMSDAGWILACNHEVFDFQTPSGPSGGASAIRFAADGSITGAWPILSGSHSNSRGAATPWGTWLSCQEAFGGDGRIWECDPTGGSPAVLRNALGVRTHGSVTVDAIGGHCYMTEAHRDGRFYRFTMLDESLSGVALTDGPLEAMVVDPGGSVTWISVPDPTGTAAPTRVQAADGFVTPMGGGVAVHDGTIVFTTGLDDRVHSVDLAAGHHSVVWDGSGRRSPLFGIGDLAVAGSGDLFVTEDRGDMEVVVVTPSGTVAPFCRMVGNAHRFSEVTGPCFDPSGDRLYVSSLRGRGEALVRDVVPDLDWGAGAEGRHVGVTYEITGPFRSTVPMSGVGSATVTPTTLVVPTTPVVPSTTTTVVPSTTATAATTTGVPSRTVPRSGNGPDPGSAAGSGGPTSGAAGSVVPLGLGAAAVLAVGGGALAVRRRREARDRGTE